MRGNAPVKRFKISKLLNREIGHRRCYTPTSRSMCMFRNSMGTAGFRCQHWVMHCTTTVSTRRPQLTQTLPPLQISVDNIVVRAICRLPNLECVEIPDCYSITNAALPDLGLLQGTTSLFPLLFWPGNLAAGESKAQLDNIKCHSHALLNLECDMGQGPKLCCCVEMLWWHSKTPIKRSGIPTLDWVYIFAKYWNVARKCPI